jgi:hypothetical protein
MTCWCGHGPWHRWGPTLEASGACRASKIREPHDPGESTEELEQHLAFLEAQVQTLRATLAERRREPVVAAAGPPEPPAPGTPVTERARSHHGR